MTIIKGDDPKIDDAFDLMEQAIARRARQQATPTSQTESNIPITLDPKTLDCGQVEYRPPSSRQPYWHVFARPSTVAGAGAQILEFHKS